MCASSTSERAHDGSRSSVSGWTRKSACFQVRTILARSTRRSRSVFRETGRWTCRRRMMSWCRNSAFSARSSALLLLRSASVPSRKEVGGGLIQRNIGSWSACKRKQTRGLIKVNTQSTNENLFFLKIGAWSEHTRTMDHVDCTRIHVLWQESFLHRA